MISWYERTTKLTRFANVSYYSKDDISVIFLMKSRSKMIHRSCTEKKDLGKDPIITVQDRTDINTSKYMYRNCKGRELNFTYVSWKRVLTVIDRIFEVKSGEEYM